MFKPFTVTGTALLLIAAVMVATTMSSSSFCSASDLITGVRIISLNSSVERGNIWTVFNGNESIKIGASVPGDIYGDLMTASVIGDPYYRFNDDNYRWVAYDYWTYHLEFGFYEAKETEQVQLVFEGIEGACNIYVNGKWIGETHDEFQKYVFPIDASSLQYQSNTLVVVFNSSVDYATNKYNAYPVKPKPVAPPYLQGLPHRNFIRAEQSSFGWDWNAAFAPVGIIKDVFLRVFRKTSAPAASSSLSPLAKHLLKKKNKKHDDAASAAEIVLPYSIDYVTPHTFPLPLGVPVTKPLTSTNNSFLVDTYVYATCAGSSECFRDGSTVLVEDANGGRNMTADWVMTTSSPCGDTNTAICSAYARVQITVNNAPLWWPRGVRDNVEHYGARSLLTVHVHSRKMTLIAETTTFIGFRSVELITYGDPLDYGMDTPLPPKDVMFFRVNGIPVFARGANVVPFDDFPSRVNRSIMEQVLESAVLANMNMVRVWGGGIFQNDDFYDMCDKKGIMVWQEMIFACSQYPINPEFLLDVRKEIKHQLRRLGRHPAIVMWSGNNENGIYDKGPGSPYEILDYSTVMDQIIREDTSRPIWPSSPSRGFKSGVTQSGLPAGTQEHPRPFVVGGKSGDTHYYNYFTCPNISVYPRTNFASEFGFQSLPWLDNFASVSEPQDWWLFSKLMNHRQHHPDGNMQIADLVQKNFGPPPGVWNNASKPVFQRVIYLSQLQQSLCIASEASFYRRGRDQPYRTSGSLYWQLNQPWQAPSWTSIEYGGEWKVLHYRMKEVYAKLHLSAFINESDDSVQAHLASDLLEGVYCIDGVEVFLVPINAAWGSDDTKWFIDRASHIPVEPLRGGIVWKKKFSALMASYKTRCPSPGDCVLFFQVACTAQLGSNTPPPTPLWLTDLKDMKLPPNQVTVSLISTTNNNITVQVTANATSLYVMLHAPAPFSSLGAFSRNAFIAFGGKPVLVSFSCTKYEGNTCDLNSGGAAFAQQFVKSIWVETLNDRVF